MKRISFAALAAVICIGLSSPASAQLLGGVLGGDGGSDGGGLLGGLGETVGGVVDTVGDTLGGTLGDSNGTIAGIIETGDGVGVNLGGLAEVSVDGNGGLNVGGSVLGGGGDVLGVPLDGLLGGTSGVSIEFPDLGGLIGGDGDNGNNGPQGPAGRPGRDGVAGTNGSNGIGVNGRNGAFGVAGRNGSNGINGLNGSSKLKLLMRILENRAWLRFAQGNKVCLPAFGVASISGWLPQRDHAAFQRLIAAYGQDIKTLQSMMKKCRGSNQAVNAGQVIGVDLRNDGTVVVFTL